MTGPHRPDLDAEALYEHAPCAHLTTDPDGSIRHVNQTFLDWIGYPRDQIVDQVRFQSLLTVGGRIYYETHYAPLLRMQGFVNEIALDMRREDGSTCPVVVSARQLLGDDGELLMNQIALFDSTDRRRYERELLLARREAEAAVAELASADQRKNEFIALLAHELRNPLAPIRGAVQLLRRTKSGESVVAEVTGVLERQVDQLARLVEDLLDASRIGQDKLAVRRAPIEVEPVVHLAIEASEPLLVRAGLDFEAVLPEVPIYVHGDGARLAQVLGNLLNNAAKFTPRGGAVSLIVELAAGEAVIRVRDTGIGIEADQLSRVFDLFMQADVPHERSGGLGIGLMLAKNLVEQHEGTLTVHSDGAGLGAEFVVRLPAVGAPPKRVSRSLGAPVEPEVVQRRILVVDDSMDAAELMALLLELAGHRVKTAADGLEAVAIVETFQPHVVFLDIGLPKVNGYEVAARIRARAGPQPFLVALTGRGTPEDRARSTEAGFDRHLVKPVDTDVVTRLIEEVPPPTS